MKKVIIFALCALLLAGCTAKQEAPETETADIEAVADTMPEESESETKMPSVPEGPITALELEKEPRYENGQLILFFTNHEIIYTDAMPASVGMLHELSASSVSAKIILTDETRSGDSGDFRCGVILEPEEVLEAGTYSLSCAFSNYVVNFDITID